MHLSQTGAPLELLNVLCCSQSVSKCECRMWWTRFSSFLMCKASCDNIVLNCTLNKFELNCDTPCLHTCKSPRLVSSEMHLCSPSIRSPLLHPEGERPLPSPELQVSSNHTGGSPTQRTVGKTAQIGQSPLPGLIGRKIAPVHRMRKQIRPRRGKSQFPGGAA